MEYFIIGFICGVLFYAVIFLVLECMLANDEKKEAKTDGKIDVLGELNKIHERV